MPKAAVDLPLPLPVWTISRPRSSVLVASMRSRAALRRAIFSLWRRLISSSVSAASLIGALHLVRSRGRCCGGGATSPRSIASRKRRLVSASAAGLCSAIKPRTVVIGEIGVVERIEMRVVDGPRGRREGEQVVDRRGDLGGALVAVAHHPGDPARVRGAAADHPAQLLAQAADARPLGPRVVIVPDRRRAARELPDGEREPALELVIIVAVEEVVLAVVLVVQHGVGAGEPRFEHARARRGPRRRRHRRSRSSRDRPRPDQPRRPRSARRSGSAARPRRRPASSRRPDSRLAAPPRRAQPLRLPACLPVGGDRGGERIDRGRLVERRDRAGRRCRRDRSGRERRRGKNRRCAG